MCNKLPSGLISNGALQPKTSVGVLFTQEGATRHGYVNPIGAPSDRVGLTMALSLISSGSTRARTFS